MSEDLLIAGSRRSWSQMNSWLSCGWSYKLQRILDTPETPSVWLPAGKAFHLATEWLDKGEIMDPQQAWRQAWHDEFMEAAAETDVPLEEWRSAGRITKDKPNGEDALWWEDAGEDMVIDYFDWRAGSGWELAEFNGVPAVEIEVSATVGGIPVKAFIDRVFITPDGQLVTTDLKTGSREPEPHQNAFYSTLMERTMGIRPSAGSYYMARKGTVTAPTNTDHLDAAFWDYMIPTFDRAVAAEIFLPNVGPLCRNCGVKDFCVAQGGSRAAEIPLALQST